MARCVRVIDGVLFVNGVQQDWTLPVEPPRKLTDKEVAERLTAIYGVDEEP